MNEEALSVEGITAVVSRLLTDTVYRRFSCDATLLTLAARARDSIFVEPRITFSGR